jgi:hypothetical protein
MGYSATKISGESIVIKKEKATEFVNLLRSAEQRFGHISWCDTIDTYMARNNNDHELVAIALMADYGFIQDRNDTSLHLITWGGDKIGSSWDDIWDILAQVVDNEVVWVMLGEDDTMWAEELKGGQRRQADVTISLAN